MNERIDLMPEQTDLLKAMVEAQRNVPRDQRRPFSLLKTFDGDTLLHPGFPSGEIAVDEGDLEVLAHEGLLITLPASHGTTSYDVHPRGFRYYEDIQKQAGGPVEQIETEIRSYLDAAAFQRPHPEAYRQWASAADWLWASDTVEEWTVIGHLCREALQHFATDLVNEHQPPDVDTDV